MSFLLRLLGGKKRNEIRGGKLWEITRLWGMDVRTQQQEILKPDKPKPTGGKVVGARVHNVLGSEDNVTNHTKDPDVL